VAHPHHSHLMLSPGLSSITFNHSVGHC